MKQLTVLNKIIIITILACFVTACSTEKNVQSDKNSKEEIIVQFNKEEQKSIEKILLEIKHMKRDYI